MSIRRLPDLPALEARPEVGFDLSPEALAAWDASVVGVEAKDQASITILESIGADFFGEGVTAKRIAGVLRSIGNKPVTVQINSPGGDFFEGLAITNLLLNHPAEVTVQILGLAASAAAVVAMAGDEIQIAKSAIMMVHNSQWVAIGDRHVMAEVADQMATFDKAMRSVFVDRTGLEDKKVGSLMDATTFMGADQAIELGFADDLMPADSVTKDTKASLGERPAAYRLDAALAKRGVPRAERRKLIKDFIEAMPRAGPSGTPGAADCAEGLARLRAARMRLNLNH